MEYTDAGSPRIGSGAAGQPLAHLFQQQSVASMNSSGTKVNHPLGKLKELLFAFTSSQPVLTCIADPILHEMWPQLGPFLPSYCSEFFLKACNALLPWPQPIDDGFGRCSRTLEAAFQRHSLALATLFSISWHPEKRLEMQQWSHASSRLKLPCGV